MESNHVESGSDGVEFPIDTSSTALPLKRRSIFQFCISPNIIIIDLP